MCTLAERDLKMKETELCLGLPGAEAPKPFGKRGFSETTTMVDLKLNLHQTNIHNPSTGQLRPSPPSAIKQPSKAQVVGWPPVRSYRSKNMIMGDHDINKKRCSSTEQKSSDPNDHEKAVFVKVSMDGAPYLRKVDLKMSKSYKQLSDSLANMFISFTMVVDQGGEGMIDFFSNESKLMDVLNSSEYVPTYQDKDGDWMLVGDVPWEMFVDSCKRLRIMKGSEAIGLAPRAVEKCKRRI